MCRGFQRLQTGRPLPLENVSYRCHFLFGYLQRLCTNAVKWKRLRHPNVVRFLGFRSGCPPFSLVYPWLPNGNLSEYLREHPDADKLGLVCVTSDMVVDSPNGPDPLSILAIGRHSGIGPPTSAQSGSRESNRSTP